MTRIREIGRDERGATLTELLTAMSVGMVVLMAALVLIDRSNAVTKEIADRQDALQRGRGAMETITRQLRSQVCLGDTTEPITYGDRNAVTFYADLSDGSKNVERRTLAYDAASETLRELTYPGTGTYPDLTFSTTPAERRVLLTKVDEIRQGSVDVPVFRYYAYRTGGAPGDMQQLATPLSAADASRVVLVKVGFVALPEGRRPEDRSSTTLENDVYVRLADPSSPAEGPRCL